MKGDDAGDDDVDRSSGRTAGFRRTLLLAAATGVATGMVVATFEAVTAKLLFANLLDAPVGVQVVAPVLGLGLAWLALRFIGDRASPSTADEYIKAFHQPGHPLTLRDLAGRLSGAVFALGLGGAMGYEGPSQYAGASIGSHVHHLLASTVVGRRERRVLLVAGAAAGVAAIFKAPATGAVFALEVPFHDDLARRSLLPALVGAASGYLTYVAFFGTDRPFAVAGEPPFDVRHLGGALLVGVLCGVGARGFAWLIRRAKHIADTRSALARIAIAGVVGSALVVVSRALFEGLPLSLGTGYESIGWALDPGRSLALVAGLALVRLLATVASVGGGAPGGLFIPLVVEGALAGRLVAGVLGIPDETLFPVIGIAAFLGAGYRVPLAAIVFVAELTGRPGFIVPALFAAVAADLVAGPTSVSAYQVDHQLR